MKNVSRFRLLFLFVSMTLSVNLIADENVFKYDSLKNICRENVHSLIGQTIICPNNFHAIPGLPNLFWTNTKGKIYKDWVNQYTRGRAIFDKPLLINDVVTLDDGQILLECRFLENKQKIYVNCNKLFEHSLPVMYVEGYLKKLKQLYMGKTLYVDKFELPYDERIDTKDVEGTGSYCSFRCFDVELIVLSMQGFGIFLTDGNRGRISIEAYEKAKSSEDEVNSEIAQNEKRFRAEQERIEKAVQFKMKIKGKQNRINELLDRKIKCSENYIERLDENILKRLIPKWDKKKIADFLISETDLGTLENLIEKYGFSTEHSIEHESFNKVNWERFDRLVKKYGKANARLMIIKRVKLGWSSDMVIESLGRPTDINRTINSWGTREQWVYREYLSELHEYITEYYYFENGILTAIQD